MARQGRRTNARVAVGLAVVSAVLAFAVYLRTMAPSLPTGDSGELITVAWLRGVAHPPGYPLFSILGHLITLLPFGSPAYRVNVMSGVFGAAAVGVTAFSIYRLVARHIGPRGALMAATGGALLFGFSAAVWSYAIVAEVFSLNSFFAAAIIAVLLEWHDRPERLRLLWLFGLLSGLASSNQQTIALLAPACLVLLGSGTRKLLSRSHIRPGCLARHAAIAGGLLLVGLLPYLYLPLAASGDPALNWGDPRTPEAFWRHLTRADYGTFNLVASQRAAISEVPRQIGVQLHNLYDGFTPPGCLLALAGAWFLWRRARAACVALIVAFVVTGPAFVAYANPRFDNPVLYGVLERFYILPSVSLAICVGAGAAQTIELVAGLRRATWRRSASLAAGVALLALPLGSLAVRFGQLDQSGNLVDHDFGSDMLAPLDRGSLFLITGDAATMAVDYLQLVEGVRSDVVSLNMEKLKIPAYVQQMRRQHPDVEIPFDVYVRGGDALARLAEANLRVRPVFLVGEPQDLGFKDRFDMQRAGFAIRLLPKGSGADNYAFMASHLDLFRQAHYPTPHFADTTFEADIVRGYGALAFDVAYVLDDGVRDQEAIPFYRLALQLDPGYAPAKKNLGLLLYKHDGPSAEVAALWTDYLRLMPDDSDAPAMRQRIGGLGQSR